MFLFPLSSAAEAELGALFHNCTDAAAIRTTLNELGHPQPPTPVKTNNITASGVVNGTMKSPEYQVHGPAAPLGA